PAAEESGGAAGIDVQRHATPAGVGAGAAPEVGDGAVLEADVDDAGVFDRVVRRDLLVEALRGVGVDLDRLAAEVAGQVHRVRDLLQELAAAAVFLHPPALDSGGP